MTKYIRQKQAIVTKMDIATLVNYSTDVNVVEAYVCPSAVSADNDRIKIGWDTEVSFTINHNTAPTVQMIKEYHHRDITYVYDLDNDGQRAMRRVVQKEDFNTRNTYTIAICEDVIPSHRFPSTQDIAHSEVIQRSSYRINNRMFFIHDVEVASGTHYYYFRYSHSNNVDTKKMQTDFDRSFRCIRSQFR